MSKVKRGYHGFKRKHSRYVYVMENKDYVKIGISFDPNERLIRLNSAINSGEDVFRVVYYVDCLDGESARALEKSLHDRFKPFQIITDIDGAKTECFSKVIKADAIAALVDVENIAHFDPFLTCHPQNYRDFLKANNLSPLQIACKLGKSLTKSAETKIQLGVSCIISNLFVAPDKKIVYCDNNVANLTSGKYICLSLLKSLFESEKTLTNKGFILPDNISIRYDVRVGSSLRTDFFRNQVRPNYLTAIYSYKNNISDFLTKMIDTKSTIVAYREALDEYCKTTLDTDDS